MSELLLLNPRRRRKAKKSGGSRKRRRTRRNPTSNLGAYLNPRRRRRRSAKRRTRRNPVTFQPRRVAARHRPGRRVGRRYLSNPRPRLTMKGITDQVVDAGTGAVGATLVDILMGFVGPRLPAQLATPQLYPVVKGGVAILFGALVGGMGGQIGRLGVAGAKGSLICTLRDTLRMYLPANVVLGYINSGMVARNGMRGMGAYVRGVNTPLMGVRTPLMGLGQNWSEAESSMYGPGYIAGGMRGVGAYVRP